MENIVASLSNLEWEVWLVIAFILGMCYVTFREGDEKYALIWIPIIILFIFFPEILFDEIVGYFIIVFIFYQVIKKWREIDRGDNKMM